MEPTQPPPPLLPSMHPLPGAAAQVDPQPPLMSDDPTSSVWDFADLLDFTADDVFSIPWQHTESPNPVAPTEPVPSPSDPEPNPEPLNRIRKRDPRLVCSNFLAGYVPCACPEIDAKLEEEGLPGKKRKRTTVRARSGVYLCQVPGCGADIRELKGYHRRHRVCLQCATASTVVLDGDTKRYCQQCGKFHILSDFDEDKRSCRRKLERHNNRRRRKPANSGGDMDKEFQQDTNPEDVAYDDDDDGGKDVLCTTSQLGEKALEPGDGQVSPLSSNPESQTFHTDSVLSISASREAQMASIKDNSNFSLSPSDCDNRNTYSSMCPTGRISFKLYDWNPAEFPRRLRLQVLQWLSTMPVELEGYIRPGCTILTLFTAMPRFMWEKLFEDPVSSIRDLVVQPRSKLLGRGTFYVYLNNMIFRVKRGGTSIVRLNMEQQAPRLHYVYPPCFEAGKPIDFVACGSNLVHSNSRFLVSFAGKYLACVYTRMTPEHTTESGNNQKTDHQLYKVSVPRTDANHFGPAFVEVENEGGVSNFMPILVSNEEVCSEMTKIQQRINKSLSVGDSDFTEVASCSSCTEFAREQAVHSQLLLDIAWILKQPSSESLHRIIPTSQIQRFRCLLNFLMENESTVILERVLQVMNNLFEEKKDEERGSGGAAADLRLLKERMDHAREFLRHNTFLQGSSSRVVVLNSRQPQVDEASFPVSFIDQDMEMGGGNKNKLRENQSSNSDFIRSSEEVPLLDVEGVMSETLLKKKRPPRQVYLSSSSMLRSRPALLVVAAAAVCFGVCAVFLHPHKVGQFAVYIHRRLFDNP